jgi:molybdate transport system substrate-binding protein
VVKLFSHPLPRLAVLTVTVLFSLNVQSEVLVAAASSIREPLDLVAGKFEQSHGLQVRISYGSSGNLAHQILRGAPYQVFLSANTEYPERIWQADRARQKPLVYARGYLSLYANDHSPCNIDSGLQGLADQIADGSIHRIAIAKPSLAPYGLATRQALTNAGLWDRLSAHLAIGNNVAQAAQFGFSGAADCAFISSSLAQSEALSHNGRSVPVPQQLYSPVRHAMILLTGSDDDAGQFFRFLLSETAAKAFSDAGFQTTED